MQIDLIPAHACLHCKALKPTEGWGPADGGYTSIWCEGCAALVQSLTLDQLSALRGYRRCTVRDGEIVQADSCCGQPTEAIQC